MSSTIAFTLHLLVSHADNLCKQFGPRSDPIKCQSRSGSKLFDTEGISERFLKKVDFEIKQQTTHSMQNYPVGKRLS